jgi:hypothetical protein
VPNCSAIVSGVWLGNITPPAPSRIDDVWSATWPITTLVADDAIDRGRVTSVVTSQLNHVFSGRYSWPMIRASCGCRVGYRVADRCARI